MSVQSGFLNAMAGRKEGQSISIWKLFFFSLQMVFDRYPSGETNVGLLYGILSTSKRETFPLVLDKQKRNVEWAYENFGILEQSQK